MKVENVKHSNNGPGSGPELDNVLTAYTHLAISTGGVEVDVVIITAALTLGNVLYQLLLLFCLLVFFRGHLPSLPPGDPPDILEEEIVIHRLVLGLGVGVVSLAA